MGEMLLPWPRRRSEAEVDTGDAPVPPHYELQRVDEDGSRGAVELLPITSPPWKARMGRRGFLGAGIASSAAAAMLLSACNRTGSSSPPPSTPAYTPPSYPPYSTPSYPSDSESSEPTYSEPTYSEPPTTTDDGGGYPGGGGTICTCNKVCTCIPVCQAHRLLDPDPAVRRMAEITVTAMGIGQQRYLAWAARNASAALADRIDDLVDDLHRGRTVRGRDLYAHDYARYLTADDQVTTIMAAQVLSLRARAPGEQRDTDVDRRTAVVLTRARELHRRRAPLWGH